MNDRNKTKVQGFSVSPAHTYTDMRLAGVVTRQEAATIWNKSYQTIDLACLKGKLAYRKSLTGGAILISVSSLADLWGIPDDMTLWECFRGEVETTSKDLYAIVAREGVIVNDY